MFLRSLKLALFLLISSLRPLSLWGQEGAVERQPYIDLRRYYGGFRIGLHLPDVRISNSGVVNSTGGRLWADTPVWHPGFSIGVVGGLTLVPQLELRLLPTLHLGDVPVAYTDGQRQVERFTLRTSSLQLPLELKWGAVRWGNYRPFVAAGSYVGLQLGTRSSELLHLRPLDYGVSIGAGCDLYFSFFKLSPQLTFQYGLTNVLETRRPDLRDDPRLRFTEAVRGGATRLLLLTFSIE
ncbi:type IX secretion/gliding motility protein PorT/SprT [Porphyromonas sp.]